MRHLILAVSVVILLVGFLVLRVEDAFVSAALFSAFMMILFDAPGVMELAGLAVVAVSAILLRVWVYSEYGIGIELIAAGLGLGGLLVMVARVNRPTAGGTARWRMMLTSAGLMTVFVAVSLPVNFHTSLRNLYTLDLYALSWDASLRFQPSFMLGRFLREHRLLDIICRFTYLFLPTTIGLTQFTWGCSETETRDRYFVLKAFVVMALIGWTLYQVFPASGPMYLMPTDFPNAPPPTALTARLLVEPVKLDPHILRNAMPSLHTSWALLVCYSLYQFAGVRRWLGVAFVIVTLVATMGMGEHYLVDLVVAFPFTLGTLGLIKPGIAWRNHWRIRAIIYGAVPTAAWLILLRYATKFFWISPVIPWTSMVVTVAIAVYFGRQLMIANDSAPSKINNRETDAGIEEAYSAV